MHWLLSQEAAAAQLTAFPRLRIGSVDPTGIHRFRVRVGSRQAQKGYPTLMYYNKPERGGHFAAWEEPQLFTMEICAAFRTLR